MTRWFFGCLCSDDIISIYFSFHCLRIPLTDHNLMDRFSHQHLSRCWRWLSVIFWSDGIGIVGIRDGVERCRYVVQERWWYYRTKFPKKNRIIKKILIPFSLYYYLILSSNHYLIIIIRLYTYIFRREIGKSEVITFNILYINGNNKNLFMYWYLRFGAVWFRYTYM